MASPAALDTTIAVVTPENIAFDYQLAGPFRRLPAYLIDLGVRWGVIIVVVICLALAGLMVSFSGLGSFVLAAGFILYFLISWFYGTVLETYFNGRTIGKWACGIRVIDTDGRPISGKRAMLRNLLRIADLAPPLVLSSFATDAMPVFLPTGMIGLLTMLFTRRMQRLGDLAAGTMVIVDERGWRLPVAKVDDPRVPALASFFPGDYRVSRSMAKTLAIYAERRHYLTPARRREIARHLAIPLIDRFEFRADIDPDLLMYALYYRVYLSDPSDEIADLGPLAGFSPLRRDQNKPQGLMGDAANPISPAVNRPATATAIAEPTPRAGSNAPDISLLGKSLPRPQPHPGVGQTDVGQTESGQQPGSQQDVPRPEEQR